MFKIDFSKRKNIARLTGLFYLLFIIASFAADNFASFAMGETEVIFDKVVADEKLFGLGLVMNLLSAFFFFLAAWGLFVLLKAVNKNMALLFLLLNLAGVVIQCLSVLNLFDAIEFLREGQLVTQAMLAIKSYRNGFLIAQLFFGAWLYPLGYTVYKSGFLPKLLGILLIVDSVAILGWFFNFFLFSNYEPINIVFTATSALAEFSLTLWLLIKGVKEV